jgi:hypothetical protein
MFGCGGRAFGTVDNTPSPSPVTIDGSEAPGAPPPVLQRGIWERIAHSWRGLYRNAPLVVGLAVMMVGVLAVGGVMVGKAPLQANAFEIINDHFIHIKAPSPLSDDQIKELLVRAEKEEAEAATRARRGERAVRQNTLASAGLDAVTLRRMAAPPVASEPLGVVGGLGLVILLANNFGIPGIFCAMLMVIALATRARGKQYSLAELSRIALPRMGRCIKTWFRVVVRAFVLPALAVGAVAGLMASNKLFGLLLIVVIPVCIVYYIYTLNMLMLAHIVAAMGVEEEPGDPLARSRQIVGLRPWHTFFGFIVSMLVVTPLNIPFILVMHMPGMSFSQTVIVQFLAMTLMTVGYFSATFFQVLLYFEGRRRLSPDEPVAHPSFQAV